jgi:hypothetical protein
MPYWTLNKETNQAGISTSLKKLADSFKLEPEPLYYHFSRKKLTEFENDKIRIVKVVL